MPQCVVNGGDDRLRERSTMPTRLEADLCVVGAGSAGLSVAAGASQMGAKTVLIEAGKMGGDCLNYGCVPSKAMLAAGHVAHTMRHAARFGVNGHEPGIDFGRVHDHVHEVIAAIAPLDSQERFEGLGVSVIRAHASFCAPDEIEAGDTRVRARRFVLATGSSPVAPPIPGLDQTPYQTNETIFERPGGARSSDRDRRRADRLRAGPGAPAAGLRRHRAGHGPDPAQGRSGADRRGARASCWRMAS